MEYWEMLMIASVSALGGLILTYLLMPVLWAWKRARERYTSADMRISAGRDPYTNGAFTILRTELERRQQEIDILREANSSLVTERDTVVARLTEALSRRVSESLLPLLFGTARSTQVIEALARGYGHPLNQDKILDADLITAMAREVMLIMSREDSAQPTAVPLEVGERHLEV